MILAELRAKGWKYATALCAALAVAAVMLAIFLAWRGASHRARADAQSARADALATQVEELQAAQYRDDLSADATTAARDAAEDRAVDQSARRERVEAIANEPRPAVPAVCPDPDARLVRELAETRARVSAAEARLRDLGRPAPNRPR